MERIRIQRANVSCNHKARHGADAVSRVGIDGTSDQGRELTLGHSGGNAPGFAEPGPFYDESVHISDH